MKRRVANSGMTLQTNFHQTNTKSTPSSTCQKESKKWLGAFQKPMQNGKSIFRIQACNVPKTEIRTEPSPENLPIKNFSPKSTGEFGILRAWATFHGPTINLSPLETLHFHMFVSAVCLTHKLEFSNLIEMLCRQENYGLH